MRISPILIFLLTSLLSACSLSTRQNPDLDAFHEGNSEYFLFDFEEAQKHYEEALELNPDLAMARNNFGNARFRQEDFEGAIDAFDVLAKDYPTYAKALYNRGLAYSYLGDYPKAIADLSKAIDIFQMKRDSAEAVACLVNKQHSALYGSSLHRLRCDYRAHLPNKRYREPFNHAWDGAATAYHLAKKKVIRESNWQLRLAFAQGEAELIRLAGCCECLGSHSPTFRQVSRAALKDLEPVDRYLMAKENLRDPAHANTEERYEARESAHYFMNKVGRLNTPASDFLDFRTLWVDHALAYAHMKRGLFRQSLGNFKGAIHDYDVTISINRYLRDSLPIGEIYFNRGNCYQALAVQRNSEAGDTLYKEAISNYDLAFHNPEDTAINAAARYQKATCLIGLRQYSAAITQLDTSISQQPSDPRPLISYAQCKQALLDSVRDFQGELAAMDSLEVVIAAYSAALEIDPTSPDALYNRANCHQLRAEHDLAFMDYSACLQLVPGYANALYMRGLTRKAMGDPEGAAQDLNDAGGKGHPHAIKQLAALRSMPDPIETPPAN